MQSNKSIFEWIWNFDVNNTSKLWRCYANNLQAAYSRPFTSRFTSRASIRNDALNIIEHIIAFNLLCKQKLIAGLFLRVNTQNTGSRVASPISEFPFVIVPLSRIENIYQAFNVIRKYYHVLCRKFNFGAISKYECFTNTSIAVLICRILLNPMMASRCLYEKIPIILIEVFCKICIQIFIVSIKIEFVLV